MNTYKEQFKEWSPAYPALFFAGPGFEYKKIGGILPPFNEHEKEQTLKANNITIKAIQKAMEL